MKPKMILKITTDMAMTILLLLLMSYSLVGEEAHEWIGAGIFLLFILHHILNWGFGKNLFRGKYTPYRVIQTVLVLLIFLSMVGSMISGIILSRYVFASLPIQGGAGFARTLHMLSAYWGFVVMSLHMGLHWSMMLGMAKRMIKKTSELQKWIFRMIGFAIATYGIYAFINREIGSYMFLKNTFVFFDFEEPLILFFLDYVAVMGSFVFFGYYMSEALKKIKKIQ